MTEELRRDSGRLDRLERMVAELHAVLLARSDAPKFETAAWQNGGGTRSANGNNGGVPHLVALPDSGLYHVDTCAMVEGRTGLVDATPSVVRRRHLEPCSICEPSAVVAV
jgi:hypothetical protein